MLYVNDGTSLYNKSLAGVLAPRRLPFYNLDVFICLLFVFAAHAVFVVVVDYCLEHHVALDGRTA